MTVEPRHGYRSASLRALEVLPEEAEVVMFIDGDGSDEPRKVESLLLPIRCRRAGVVVGSRILGRPEPGAIRAHRRLGNRLVTGLLAIAPGHRYTGLGPFRAIRADSLRRLGMRDRGYGWTVEMQIKAPRRGLRVAEEPVSRRPRIAGESKVCGSVRGRPAGGFKILWTVVRSVAAAPS